MASSYEGGGGPSTAVRVAEMEKMSVEQLKAIKEQSDLEVNLLQDSLNNLRTAVRVAEMEKMSVEQLKAIKEQSDLKVNLLQDSLNNLRTATARLEIASTALHQLSLRVQGKKMLVPLIASLYVLGTLDDANKVLVDIGTGYFVEPMTHEIDGDRRREQRLTKGKLHNSSTETQRATGETYRRRHRN